MNAAPGFYFCILNIISVCYKELKALFHQSLLQNYSLSSQVADIPLLKDRGFKDDHLSMSLRFFSLPLWKEPNGRGP